MKLLNNKNFEAWLVEKKYKGSPSSAIMQYLAENLNLVIKVNIKLEEQIKELKTNCGPCGKCRGG